MTWPNESWQPTPGRRPVCSLSLLTRRGCALRLGFYEDRLFFNAGVGARILDRVRAIKCHSHSEAKAELGLS